MIINLLLFIFNYFFGFLITLEGVLNILITFFDILSNFFVKWKFGFFALNCYWKKILVFIYWLFQNSLILCIIALLEFIEYLLLIIFYTFCIKKMNFCIFSEIYPL